MNPLPVAQLAKPSGPPVIQMWEKLGFRSAQDAAKVLLLVGRRDIDEA